MNASMVPAENFLKGTACPCSAQQFNI